jgi:hypothetical protein
MAIMRMDGKHVTNREKLEICKDLINGRTTPEEVEGRYRVDKIFAVIWKMKYQNYDKFKYVRRSQNRAGLI